MKSFVPFLFVIAVCAAGVIEDPTLGYKEGDRFFYFPDADGTEHLVDALAPVDEAFIRAHSNSDNKYLLFTRSNLLTPQYLVWGDANSILNSNFDPRKETVVFAHGWNGDGYHYGNVNEAFLQSKDVNMIQLDWSRLANRNYVTAKSGVSQVGRELGEFLEWLSAFGLDFDRVHLVGFSLGGHLVGSAGRAVQGKIRRITALDPAGPLWGLDSSRVKKTDGQYVEVIHTNTAFLGYSGQCGHADFYPNGGSTMPGCLTNSCSHGRAVAYMVSSIKYDHLHANECSSTWQLNFNNCKGSLYPMGNSDLNKSGFGLFRVNTERNYPF